jgi:hypothetical protein
MTVVAPPKPSPPRLDPEALIEEARRRTRRRRLKFAAVGVLALAIAGGIYGGLELAGTSTNGQFVPPGFTLVQAKGPVSYAQIEIREPRPPLILDLASGEERPAKVTWEAWFDRGTGLDRVAQRVDRDVQFDLIGQATCGGGNRRFCLPPGPPFDLGVRGFRWPLNPRYVRQVATGTFRGRDVIWIAELSNGRVTPHGDRVALDRATHKPLVYQVARGTPLPYEQIYSTYEDLPGKDVSFVVPKGGAPEHLFPPAPTVTTQNRGHGLEAARRAFASTPLWLGRSFEGHHLDSVEVGIETALGPSGATIDSAKLVELRYGPFTIREFGSDRPVWQANGPAPGRALLAGWRSSLVRDGFLVTVSKRGGTANRDDVLALAKALQPIPPG